MYLLNKLVWFVLNPAMLVLLGAVAGFFIFLRTRFRRTGLAVLALTGLFFWFMSSLAGICALGLPLERDYLSLQRPKDLPQAGAIVALGGGVGKRDEMAYPELYDGADRLHQAARLYKAGKAPLVVVSGTGEDSSAVPILLELGVPRAAIAVDNESRNTYENSRFVENLLSTVKGSDPLDVKRGDAAAVDALVVTSAWHLPRAMGNFSRTSLRCAPAPCDFKAHDSYYARRYFWDWISPTPEAFALTAVFAKEWLGRLARK